MSSEARKTKRELIEENDALRRRLVRWEAIGKSGSSAGSPTADGSPHDAPPGMAAYHRVLENSGAIALELDESGSITYVTPSIQSVLGYAPDEVMNQGRAEWVHQADRDHLVECFVKLVASGDSETVSFRLRHKDGRWLAFEVSASPYRDAEGLLKIVAHARDISHVSEMDLALREAHERNRVIDEMTRDTVLIIETLEGKMLWANSGLMNLMGYSIDEFEDAKAVSAMIHPSDRERVDGIFYASLKEVGDTAVYEPYRFRHKDGSYGWYTEVGRVYQTEAGEKLILCVVRDVTAIREALEELRESEQRYRIMDELNRDVILIQTDEMGRALWANSALYDLLGLTLEDLSDTQAFFSRCHPNDVSAAEAVFEERRNEVGRMIHYPLLRSKHKDGSWAWLKTIEMLCEKDSGERFFIHASRDVTEQVQAEEERRLLAEQNHESQRLESLGVMAGGIAHDFNNLLTPIVGETSLALMDLEPKSPLRSPLLKIQKAAHRAAALTNQMLTYSGQGPRLVEPLDLSQLVEEMGELLESNISGGAVLSYSFARELPAVEGDSSQLSQIVMNLISNAKESVREGSGHIAIRTGVVDSSEVDTEHVVGSRKLGPGRFVFLEVTDDGCGMDAETRQRIFDPFFTTKFTGRGLGLASVLGIVRGHKGLIVLESEVGGGTRFQVLLPAVKARAAEKTTAPETPEFWQGDGTVLVVDDDEGVRELADATLRRAGLRVLLASDGREGLELFRRHADEIRVVVLDRTMPIIGGDTVFEEIRRIQPGAAVILMSGYSEDRAMDHIGKKLDAFLHKPFEASALLDTIRSVVEAKSE